MGIDALLLNVDWPAWLEDHGREKYSQTAPNGLLACMIQIVEQ